MKEIKTSEVDEFGSNKSENFKKIQPENGMTTEKSRASWDKEYYDDNDKLYRTDNELQPNNTYEINGYKYKTDDSGRIVSAEGKLQIRDHEGRHSIKDSREVIARGEMNENNDRGHLIGDQFNGAADLSNVVEMDGKLNKGDYNKLEKTLASAVSDGAEVMYKVEPIYKDDSYRPTEFKVSYSIDGDKEVVVFKNGRGD